MKRKPAELTKSETLRIRLTPDEAKLFQATAARYGMEVSTWLRSTAYVEAKRLLPRRWDRWEVETIDRNGKRTEIGVALLSPTLIPGKARSAARQVFSEAIGFNSFVVHKLKSNELGEE